MKTIHWALASVSVCLLIGVSAWVEASSGISPSMLEAAQEVVAKRGFVAATGNGACTTKARASAEKLDAAGPVYAVSEPDILHSFMEGIEKMKSSGEYSRRFNESKETIRGELQNPRAVEGLSKAVELKTRALEPSIPETLPEKLLREAANVPMPKLKRELLFIDGEDEESLKAAKKLGGLLKNMRVVLVGGSIAQASRFLGRRIFFDQAGALTRTFGFTATPAIVYNGEDGPYVTEFAADKPEEVLSLVNP